MASIAGIVCCSADKGADLASGNYLSPTGQISYNSLPARCMSNIQMSAQTADGNAR